MTPGGTSGVYDNVQSRPSYTGDPLMDGDSATVPDTTAAAAAAATAVKTECLAKEITPCPQFERLRGTAKEDREEKYIKRQQEMKRAGELQRRQEVLSQNISMKDYYATLFRMSQTGTSAAASGASGGPSSPVEGILRARDVLNDVEESFISYYYKMHPDALERKKEAEEAEAQRRQSARVAAQLASFSGALPRSKSISQRAGSVARKKKQKESVKEGAPAANLRVLLAALLDAADNNGLITRDALVAALKHSPFDVHDVEAIEALFFIVRASSTAPDPVESEADRRLDASCSMSALMPRARMRNASQRMSIVAPAGSPITMAPSSPTASSGPLPASLRRPAPGPGTSQSITRQPGFTPRPSRALGTSLTLGTTGLIPAMEIISLPTVRVREVLAAMDAVINGPELRETVRSVCFDVLEIDGYIHKTTLRTMRLVKREACEEKNSIVTPSIVKALGDALEVMLQEEEAEFLRSQMKGKRRAKSAKAPQLLPHQKSVIPLHMMRRSHINLKEFTRSFDEMPMLVAAFAHVWIPAFFATMWPPVKRSMTSGSNGDAVPDDDDNNDNNNSEGVPDETRAWRRNAARRVVTERLEVMKQITSIAPDALIQR